MYLCVLCVLFNACESLVAPIWREDCVPSVGAQRFVTFNLYIDYYLVRTPELHVRATWPGFFFLVQVLVHLVHLSFNGNLYSSVILRCFFVADALALRWLVMYNALLL